MHQHLDITLAVGLRLPITRGSCPILFPYASSDACEVCIKITTRVQSAQVCTCVHPVNTREQKGRAIESEVGTRGNLHCSSSRSMIPIGFSMRSNTS